MARFFIFITQVDPKDTLSTNKRTVEWIERVFSMNHKYQLKMVVQNMTQVKPRSPAITQRL